MVQNDAYINQFKMEARSMAFNVKKYKMFIVMISYPTLQLTFKKMSFVDLHCSITEYTQLLEKNLKYSHFQLYMRQN